MKDQLLELLSGMPGYNTKLNTIREYLQAYMLRILYKNNFFMHCAFLGGTCLRFVYNNKRFSEDLDFSLQESPDFDFEKTLKAIEKELQDSGYNTVVVKIKKNGVYSGMFKFPGLLFEAGMTHREEENVSIKIELDMKPPAGARTEPQIVNKYFMSGLTCFDLSTLLAGKINAILTRNYVKGRDYYDLFWYLTTFQELEPNLDFLRNALTQFNVDRETVDKWVSDWRGRIIEILDSTAFDWDKIDREVGLLIENRESLELFSKDNLLLLLRQSAAYVARK